MLFKARRFRFDFSQKKKVLILGVINITPDSFSDGMRYLKPHHALKRARALEAQGADIIYVGA